MMLTLPKHNSKRLQIHVEPCAQAGMPRKEGLPEQGRPWNLRCDRDLHWRWGESNPRPIAENPEKTRDSEQGAAPGAAGTAPNLPSDPVLQRVIDAWQQLPEAVRVGILAMVDSSSGDKGRGENVFLNPAPGPTHRPPTRPGGRRPAEISGG